MDFALRRIEMRPCLDYLQRRLQRIRIRSAASLLEETTSKPATKTLASDQPSLAMIIDGDIGISIPGRGVKQFTDCASPYLLPDSNRGGRGRAVRPSPARP